MPSPDHPSAALLAANVRLAALREQNQQQRKQSVPLCQPQKLTNAAARMAVSSVDGWPAHLGWDSPAVMTVLRKQSRELPAAPAFPLVKETKRRRVFQEATGRIKGQGRDVAGAVKVYPGIALGMLRQEAAAAGRIWLLARYLDGMGAGSLRIVNLRQRLTDKKSPLYVCGWRQLRNLLRQGEGIFWQRGKVQLWLRSAAKTAAALGVGQLTGRPVALPVVTLLGTIGAVRAHLYASFHSGRQKETAQAERMKPIARVTLARLSGAAPASQRLYEQRARVQTQAHFAVGERVSGHNEQEHAWQRGGALFTLADFQGQQGRKGGSYLAWQLPNSYAGPHQQRPKGRQKRINRELKDLVMQGMPGNEQEKIEKRYYVNGAQAARGYGRSQRKGAVTTEVYWPRLMSRQRRYQIWQVIGPTDS